jgi:hypothetical protein
VLCKCRLMKMGDVHWVWIVACLCSCTSCSKCLDRGGVRILLVGLLLLLSVRMVCVHTLASTLAA